MGLVIRGPPSQGYSHLSLANVNVNSPRSCGCLMRQTDGRWLHWDHKVRSGSQMEWRAGARKIHGRKINGCFPCGLFWMFPKIGGKTPQNGWWKSWFQTKWKNGMIWGVWPYFWFNTQPKKGSYKSIVYNWLGEDTLCVSMSLADSQMGKMRLAPLLFGAWEDDVKFAEVFS